MFSEYRVRHAEVNGSLQSDLSLPNKPRFVSEAFSKAQIVEYPESGNRMEQFNKIAKQRWSSEPLTDGLADINPQSLHEVIATIDELYELYPEMKGSLSEVILGGGLVANDVAGQVLARLLTD